MPSDSATPIIRLAISAPVTLPSVPRTTATKKNDGWMRTGIFPSRKDGVTSPVPCHARAGGASTARPHAAEKAPPPLELAAMLSGSTRNGSMEEKYAFASKLVRFATLYCVEVPAAVSRAVGRARVPVVARVATAEATAGSLKTGDTVPTNVPVLSSVRCAHTTVVDSRTRRQERATSKATTLLRMRRRRGFVTRCCPLGRASRSAWTRARSASAGALSSGGWAEADCEPFMAGAVR